MPTLDVTYKIRIELQYPESKVPKIARRLGMFIVGEGIGLSWNKRKKLSKGMKDRWFIVIAYVGSSSAAQCVRPDTCEHNQRYVEFRFYRGRKEMIGPNFRLDLPLATSIGAKNELLIPTARFHPWFDNVAVTLSKPVSYTLRSLGKRRVTVLLPASFRENSHKKYKTLIVLDDKMVPALKGTLSDLTSSRGVMEEIALIGIEVKTKSDLLPLQSQVLKCKRSPSVRGDRTCDSCIKCFSDEFVEPCEAVDFQMEFKKCAVVSSISGRGMIYLNSILTVVLSELVKTYKGRLRVDRAGLGIMGYGLSGMTACYGAVKFHWRIGTAICMSPRLAWPDMEKSKRFFFDIVENYDKLPSGMRIYMDATENDDWQFTPAAVYDTVKEAVKVLQKKFGFVLDRNLFYHLISRNDKVGRRENALNTKRIYARAWIPLTTMYRPPKGAKPSAGSASCLLEKRPVTQLSANRGRTNRVTKTTKKRKSCPASKGGFSLIVLIGSVLGTFIGTLVVTVIVMYLCRPSSSPTVIDASSIDDDDTDADSESESSNENDVTLSSSLSASLSASATATSGSSASGSLNSGSNSNSTASASESESSISSSNSTASVSGSSNSSASEKLISSKSIN